MGRALRQPSIEVGASEPRTDSSFSPLQFWIQLIFGGFVQALHFFCVPETRATVLLDREAKRRRKTGEDPNVYGPNELKEHRFDTKEVLAIMTRPFVMFYREPIVLCLSLLSGYADALVFILVRPPTPSAYGRPLPLTRLATPPLS